MGQGIPRERAAEVTNQIIDVSLPWVVICDLDGTLALKHPDRDIHDASTCDQDLPNGPVVDVLLAMWLKHNELVFVTCRSERYREQTEAFIGKYLTCPSDKFTCSRPDYMPIPHALIMKSAGDDRPDEDIKKEMYETRIRGLANVRCVLEDMPSVVKMYRDLGLFVFDVGFTVY